MKIGIGLLMVLWVGCFAGRDRVGSDLEALRSEVEFIEVDEGLESSVQIDSLIWQPFLPLPGSGLEGSGDFDGAYQAVFRNVGMQEVWVRYDLRFFDREEFLLDAFIPFGQPVVLAAGEVKKIEGEFRVRLGDPRDIELLSLMRLGARVRWPDVGLISPMLKRKWYASR
jgi:hypothetical protein